MAGSTGGQKTTAKQDGAKDGESTPGTHDLAMAANSNPSTEQVTVQAGETVEAEGERLRKQARDARPDDAPVTLAAALNASDEAPVQYDETGALVTPDGKKVALAADALDPDVGWTAQRARFSDDKEADAYPAASSVPDQTFHPAELPDPVAAVRAGLLPQNTEVLNIDPEKFAGKKSLEP